MATRPDCDSEPDRPTTSALTHNPIRVATPPIYHLSFNQNYTCFLVGLQNGFWIFDTDPFKPSFRRDLDTHGGIGLVSMLYRSNIFCLVGGGPDPIYPRNKVMIWDDHASRCIGELSFRSEVKNVKLRLDMIIVVLNQKIFVYNFMDFKLLNQVETVSNPTGLCEISHNSSPMRFECLIPLDGTLLQEVRRGADRADIYSLAFSSDAQFLAVSSDKGTVHIFSLQVDSGSLASLSNDRCHNPSEQIHSRLSSLSIFKGVLPKYFSSEWSVARFRLPEGLQYFVGFGHQKNNVIIIGMDGRHVFFLALPWVTKLWY
ncbi:hypothetical protein OIU78_021278 [Salix suchowensis]|nr:hypothetical protein OIU78_021278 [Salix suchowensis]